jgi:hypothetical protein
MQGTEFKTPGLSKKKKEARWKDESWFSKKKPITLKKLFCDTSIQTQSRTLVRQMHYHLGHFSSIFILENI